MKTDLILSHFTGEDASRAYRAKVQAYAREEKCRADPISTLIELNNLYQILNGMDKKP